MTSHALLIVLVRSMGQAQNIRLERPAPGDLPRIMEILRAAHFDRIGGAEMPSFHLEDCFIARLEDGRIAGVAGYRMLDPHSAKTTLLAVDPAFRRMGIGELLQRERMDYLRTRGIRHLFTNCDDENVIRWYEKKFGYRRTGGHIAKVEPFGLPDKDEWITLVVDLQPEQQPPVINACLTGMLGSKEKNPDLPLSPEEISRDALAVSREDAGIVHLHARDAEGKATWKATVYREIIARIRAESRDLVICVSTSGRFWHDRERRTEVLRLEDSCRPDMASLSLGSVMFPQGDSVNTFEDICFLAQTMKAFGIRPEMEIFDVSMVDVAHRLADMDLIVPPFYFNIILGNRHSAPATVEALEEIVSRLPAGSIWAGAGIGRAQAMVNRMALERDGGARVGLEDSLFHYAGETKTPATNVELVRRTAAVARAIGRSPATPAETRKMLGLCG